MRTDLRTDARLASNNARVLAREWMLPLLRERLAPFTAAELGRRFEARGLPYAPITRPEDLFDDPHLAATGGLAPVEVPADASGAARPVATRVPLLPLALDGERLALRHGPPAVGAQADELLAQLGYTAAEVDALRREGVLAQRPA
jgi:crotonobetainyl-CoA:carnitine CoA-transferase CaiB-like acyl-CoA transferase